MITMEVVKDLEKKEKLHLAQAEKRAHQYLVLLAASEEGGILKGGTLLDIVYSSGRFSEDVDLEGDPSFLMKSILNTLKDFGEDFEYKIEKKKYLLRLTLRIRGPMYTGNPRTLCHLSVDINREIHLRDLASVIVDPPFLPPFEILTYDLIEVLADKIRVLMVSPNPKDLYDAFFIMTRLRREKRDLSGEIEEIREIIRKKLKITGERIKYSLSEGCRYASSKWKSLKAYLKVPISKEKVLEALGEFYESFERIRSHRGVKEASSR